jgi:hypothetical protein
MTDKCSWLFKFRYDTTIEYRIPLPSSDAPHFLVKKLATLLCPGGGAFFPVGAFFAGAAEMLEEEALVAPEEDSEEVFEGRGGRAGGALALDVVEAAFLPFAGGGAEEASSEAGGEAQG